MNNSKKPAENWKDNLRVIRSKYNSIDIISKNSRKLLKKGKYIIIKIIITHNCRNSFMKDSLWSNIGKIGHKFMVASLKS